MPILLPEPPPEATVAVADRLRRVGESRSGGGGPALGGSDPSRLEPTDPHQVFALGLRDLLDAPDALAAAQPVGWRFLLADREGALAAAQTVGTPDGGHRFASFTSGPYVRATVDTLAGARDDPQVAEENVEMRLLTVPALNLTAVWLHGEDTDLLLPLNPAPPGVEGRRQYAAADLLSDLREPARGLVGIGAEDTTGS